MRLTRLSCLGFRGIRDPFDLDVPPGFLVVTGRNGSGKTTLCDLIEFALTGELRRHADDTERKERIEDYVWWRGTDPPRERFVSLCLADEDGQVHEVRRTPRGLEQPGSEEDLRALIVDTVRAPLSPIARILDAAIIRDEEITRLSIDLPEADRFRFVRGAIGETDLPGYAQTLRAASELLKERRDGSVGQYTAVRSQIASLSEKIAEHRAEMASSEVIATAEHELRALSPAVESVSELVQQGRRRFVWLRSQADQLASLAEEVEGHQRQSAWIQSADYRSEGERLVAARDAIAQRIEDTASERAALANELDALSDADAGDVLRSGLLDAGTTLGLSSGRCPLCGSDISEARFHAHIAEARADLDARNARVAAIARRHTSTQAKESGLRAEFEKAERELTAHDQLSAAIEARRAYLIQAVRELIPGASELDVLALRKAAESKREEARALERNVLALEASGAAERVQQLEEELTLVRSEGESIKRECAAAGEAYEKGRKALHAVLRVEGELIEERLAQLGPLLEELYRRMRPHLDWPRLSYHIRGDVRRFLSLQIGEDLNPRFMFSSGQRRAIGIAFLVAVYLSTDWSRLRSLVLDDPVQHIDDFRALHLVELLNALRKHGHQIVCTAEDPQLAGLIARKLQGLGDESGAVVELSYEPGAGVKKGSVRPIEPDRARVIRYA